MGRTQRGQHGVNRLHDAAQQHARQNCQPVAHRLRLQQVELRRFAALHHIQQAWPVHALRHRCQFFQVGDGFDERQVRAGGEGGIDPGDGFLQAQHGSAVSAGDDHDIRVAPGSHGSTDFGDELVLPDHLFARQVAAALGRDLVLQMQPRHSGALVFADGAGDVQFVAIAGVGISDQRQVDRAGDDGGIARHLRQRQQSQIGIAAREAGARSRHVRGREPGLLHQPGGDAVINTGGNHDCVLGQQSPKLRSLAHVCVSGRRIASTVTNTVPSRTVTGKKRSRVGISRNNSRPSCRSYSKPCQGQTSTSPSRS